MSVVLTLLLSLTTMTTSTYQEKKYINNIKVVVGGDSGEGAQLIIYPFTHTHIYIYANIKNYE